MQENQLMMEVENKLRPDKDLDMCIRMSRNDVSAAHDDVVVGGGEKSVFCLAQHKEESVKKNTAARINNNNNNAFVVVTPLVLGNPARNLINTTLFILLILLSTLTEPVYCGYLQLSPNLRKAIRVAGDDHSFFISCFPFSSLGGPLGDSRVRARELSWKRKLSDDRWVVMGSITYERVHVEQSPDGRGLDLVFRSIRPDDRGEYSCQAVLDDIEEEVNFELKVLEPISFNRSYEVQSVQEGSEKFILKCDVGGNPQPKISWNVRGNIIRGGTHKYEVMDNGLIIFNLSKTDQGSYKCKATQIMDGVADFQDLVIELKVEHKPIWVEGQRTDFFGYVSGKANVSCQVVAEPRPEFTWLDKYNNEISRERFSTEGNTSFLTVNIEHDDTFGDYTCIAKNKIGKLRRTVSLTEGAKPGMPRIEILSISHESAVLRIEENQSEMFLDIVGFKVEVKLKMEEWENATIWEFKKNNDSMYAINDLLPKTLYLVRAQAKNLAGFSDSSNIIFLRTKAPHVAGTLLDQNSLNGATTTTNFSFLKVVFSVITILMKSWTPFSYRV